MNKILSTLSLKIILCAALALIILGFFYFETSPILRVLVILLGLFGVWQISASPEIISVVTLYLGLYVLYNIRYGLAVPMGLIMVAVFFLTFFLLYYQNRVAKSGASFESNLLKLYLVASGIIILEIFLAMSFWPVDPKTKSLVIVVAFYLISKIMSLKVEGVLTLKKAISFIAVSLIVMGGAIIIGSK